MKALIGLFLFVAIASFAHSEEVKMFKKPTEKELRTKLSAIQFDVTQKNGTERPFSNLYWDQKAEGIYVDIVSGEPLFSSRDKFDSGTGWPSFSKPLKNDFVVLKEERSIFGRRTEVRSKLADSHLGHVFDDGPAPTGLRYCMNSASLKFIAAADLKAGVYGEYAQLFEQQLSEAIFAGGCFWCMQSPYDHLLGKGVTSVIVGYSGGHKENPTYEQVTAGGTGHKEVVQVKYDPKLISYEKLLEIFWKNIDPFDSQGQFCDKGESYQSAIYVQNDQEKELVQKSIKQLGTAGLKTEKIVTQVLSAKAFFPAEEYHQSYYKKNPIRYKYYRNSCKRDQRLAEVWSKIKIP